jgi:hypothetical protein
MDVRDHRDRREADDLGRRIGVLGFGTATRTISQPALASAAICAVVASTSCVFVSVIDWTTTGAPPPISTPPTLTERSLPTRDRTGAGR